jgi:hypothetical protein
VFAAEGAVPFFEIAAALAAADGGDDAQSIPPTRDESDDDGDNCKYDEKTEHAKEE